MRVIAWRKLREFIESFHADAAEPLRERYRTAEVSEWMKLADY